MSLTDALLLEGPRLNVWIALRADECKGTGTETDPFNGSIRLDPPNAVSSITKSGRVATVSTGAVAHGYLDGEVVTIAGATGADAKYYNGMFTVYEVTSTTFLYWMKDEPGADASGTKTCAKTSFRFDEVMDAESQRVGQDTRIHLGPGVFLTRGWNADNIGIEPQSGQKIVGSGMGVTTLRLVNVPRWKANSGSTPADRWQLSPYAILGTWGRMDGFEISDLTLDCNLDGQLQQGAEFPTLVCSALRVPGSHVRFRRIRAINFGTTIENQECFVLSSAGANPTQGEAVDCVIEDCIVEQPAVSSAYQTTCIIMSGGERSSDGVMAWNRACAIRNCVVDGEHRINPVPISSISAGGTSTATVTTPIPHDRITDDWVRISGAKVNGLESSLFNGAFKITKTSDTTFTYGLASATSDVPTGDKWVDRFPSHRIPLTGAQFPAVFDAGLGRFTALMTTATPHYRSLGDWVRISSDVNTAYVGWFKVILVDSGGQPLPPTQFRIMFEVAPGGEFQGQGFVGALWRGVTGELIEGCRLLNIEIGGPYHDFWTHKELIARNNYYRNVKVGPCENLGVGAGHPVASYILDPVDFIELKTLELDDDGETVKAETTHAHGMTDEDVVLIAGVTGQDADKYNGTWDITFADPTHFHYQPDNPPTVQPQSGTPRYATEDRQRLLASLSYETVAGKYVAIAETLLGHGLVQGDAVYVSRANNALYNEYHTLTYPLDATDPDETTFKYELKGDPLTASETGYFGRLWQTERIVIENNVIELKAATAFWDGACGILLGGAMFAEPPLYKQVCVRRNTIRFADPNATEPYAEQYKSRGILASGCANLIVEANVVDLERTNPIVHRFCKRVNAANNSKSSGQLIQCSDMDSGKKLDELATAIKDATVMCL